MTEHNSKKRNYNLKETTQTYVQYYITKGTSEVDLEHIKNLILKE